MTTISRNNALPLGAADAPDALVDAQWLAGHLHDPDVRVVEVDVSSVAYDEWHIDGAALWDVYTDLKDGDYHLVDRAELERLFVRTGIRPGSTVVFYGYAPALGFWLMKLYGHAEVRVLDCSRDAWRIEGRPWTQTSGETAPGAYHLGDQDPALRAHPSSVQDAIHHPTTRLVDVRSEAEYRGECFWPSGAMDADGRAGHIPSALHQPIDGLYDSRGAFRSAADLRRIFPLLDLDSDGELITYCTIGGRAATAWFVLTELLGRARVRVYDGSWAEWGRMAGAPVETA
jgi:thiosulfate/3-mercaptopyruvate sulfurtransferase